MADGHHLEKPKNGHISATDCPIGTKFDTMTHIRHRVVTAVRISNVSKSNMANGRHLENRKIFPYQQRLRQLRCN